MTLLSAISVTCLLVAMSVVTHTFTNPALGVVAMVGLGIAMTTILANPASWRKNK